MRGEGASSRGRFVATAIAAGRLSIKPNWMGCNAGQGQQIVKNEALKAKRRDCARACPLSEEQRKTFAPNEFFAFCPQADMRARHEVTLRQGVARLS
jgi:hypothetical protein